MKPGTTLFRFTTAAILLAIYIAAPLAGAVLNGHTPAVFLEFPPRTEAVEGVPFSWLMFTGFVLFTLVTTWPFWKRMVRVGRPFTLSGFDRPFTLFPGGDRPAAPSAGMRVTDGKKSPFPIWGWAGLAGVALFWFLNWNRFDFLETSQRLLFFPLWFSFILFLNALSKKLSGKSLITERPLFFGLLFPVSALFWWSFEYLNRFVNNWHYVGIGDLGAGQYFLEATLSFSTVIPAVLSIRFILVQFPLFHKPVDNFPARPFLIRHRAWAIIGALSIAGLIALGLIPNLLYPLIWVLPGLLWISFQKINGYTSPLLKKTAAGDYTLVWTSACAAIVCGFFWELWNVHSAAKWIYTVPGVDRFHIFEMPLVGYAGYLPFGVVCALISNSLLNTLARSGEEIEENLPSGTLSTD